MGLGVLFGFAGSEADASALKRVGQISRLAHCYVTPSNWRFTLLGLHHKVS
jgi:hypothetical protein